MPDGQLLQSNYHPSNSMKNLPYAQSQQANIANSSRLNPKAPDFSSTVYNAIPPKQTPQMYNGFPMPNQTNVQIYTGAKPTVDSYQRTSQNRWPLMQIQPPPLTQHQSELISGMATGMTLHSLARATGSEILENGPDMGMVNHSPNMSPNLQGVHNMHQPDPGLYIEDRKQPQPIGTERGRKMYPNSDLGGPPWMFGNESKPPPRWTNTSEHFNLNRAQVYSEDLPHYIDAFQVRYNLILIGFLQMLEIFIISSVFFSNLTLMLVMNV